jgi:hypothetical protein
VKGFFVSVAAAVLFAGVAEAETRAEFCATQNSFCILCSGVGSTVPKTKCLATCKQRLAACHKTGCFEWIAVPTVCHAPEKKN